MPNIVFVIKIPNQITLVVWLQLRPEISKWLRIVYYPCQQSKPFTEWKMGKLDMSVVVSSMIIIVACTHIPFLGNENICKLLLYVCIIIGLM